MSGHSKWSTIKRKKGAQDTKRSKIFTKVIKEITIAVREGGDPAPGNNPSLRLAINNAKGVNMPKENIERAIKKASESGGEDFSEITYEGYAPGGVAVFVECTTDNPNRTISNVRHCFTSHGGNLGTSGSVDYMFERKGIFTVPKAGLNEDEFTLELIDAGAEDVELEEGYFHITTAMEDFGKMQQYLESKNVNAEKAGLERLPATTNKLDLASAKKVLNLIETLEEDDDVQSVYHNMEITDEIMEEIG